MGSSCLAHGAWREHDSAAAPLRSPPSRLTPALKMLKRQFVVVAVGALVVSCTSDESPLTAPSPMAPRAAHHNSSLAPTDLRTILGPVAIVRDNGAPVVKSFV